MHHPPHPPPFCSKSTSVSSIRVDCAVLESREELEVPSVDEERANGVKASIADVMCL